MSRSWPMPTSLSTVWTGPGSGRADRHLGRLRRRWHDRGRGLVHGPAGAWRGSDPPRSDRLADGYGLSNAASTACRRRRLRGRDLRLWRGERRRSRACAPTLGLDVIVTDHHLPAGRLPRAVAVVDPHRPDCTYPDADLTGAGTRLQAGACAALASRRVCRSTWRRSAAIGTIADLAPMTGESRAIVGLGLAELAATKRAGLRALLARACEAPDSVRPLGTWDSTSRRGSMPRAGSRKRSSRSRSCSPTMRTRRNGLPRSWRQFIATAPRD